MLTDTKIRRTGARAKPQKLWDGGGLYLYVSTTGAKSWRYDYRIAGRRETVTFGLYPDVTLDAARDKLAEARRLVGKRESPALAKQREKLAGTAAAANTFRTMGEAWFAETAPHRSESWRVNARRWLDDVLYPDLGSRPISEIVPADILSITKRIASGGHARTAEYVRQTASRIFKHAIGELRAESNPAREISVASPPRRKRGRLESKDIAQFVERTDAYRGRLVTKLATKLLLLTFVRKNELANAKWGEFDLDAAVRVGNRTVAAPEWRIPAERMKMDEPHVVPLSKQAADILRRLKPLASKSVYVFPSISSLREPMNANTLNRAFSHMGYAKRLSPHGVRATAATILNEQGWSVEAIERQLAHAERNKTRAAYNQAQYLDERRHMMQAWADYIDGLVAGENVTPIRRTRHKSS
jgi:integrase